MALRIPVTATGMADWIRKCANAVNETMGRVGTLEASAASLDTRATALEGRATTLEGHTSDLETRMGAAETAITANHKSPFLMAVAFPDTPDEGDGCYRTDEHKAYIYDGTTWQALF